MAAGLTPRPITPAAFAPYGRVLVGEGQGRLANQGTARRHDFLVELANRRPAAGLNVARFECAAQSLPLEVSLIERHPHSTQLFVPMAAGRYLVVVEGGEGPEAFTVAGEAIAYSPGVWHAPMVALDVPLAFIMLVHEAGTDEDTVIRRLDRPWRVEGR